MQIVYISNRPEVLAGTWAHVRHFMGWVDRALVVAPKATHAEIRLLTAGEVVPVDDTEVTGIDTAGLAALDHVSRNVTLRRGALDAGLLDDEFLLSDDDYRPLRHTEVTTFIEDDRHIGYYCYDLASWPGDSTDFDRAQHRTHLALAYLGAGQRCYGSHQPQIMDREILRRCFTEWDALSDSAVIDEWSLYFNLGRLREPERFAEPRPFETLCWPQYPNEWPWWTAPGGYRFENFYPELYQPGHLFAGLPTTLSTESPDRLAFEKIIRWSEFGRSVARLDFEGAVANPWTQQSGARRATFRVLSGLRKAHDYVTLDDRSTLALIAGSLRRVEEQVRDLRGALGSGRTP